MLKIAMIAGEASGDMLAASLIASLQQQANVELVGIGGPMMQKLGFHSWQNMETLSVMGYLEVIKSLPALIKLRYTILKQLLAYQPDVFIGIDAPDFNFYIEAKLKQAGIKTVHYISPTIWAWRYSRIYKIKRSTDLMLCIFPFEEKIYAQVAMNAKFIGHPLAASMPMAVNVTAARAQLKLAPERIVYTILCGSRKREITSLASTLIATCQLIAAQIKHSLFIFPCANQTTLTMLQNYLRPAEVNFDYQLILHNTLIAINAADFVIAKSGTVSLEAALAKKPMLICYKVNKITAWLMRKILTINYVGQPNIIAGKEIVKEFLQEAANPHNMSQYMLDLYHNTAAQQQMISNFYTLHQQLQQTAATNAATAILQLMQQC